jgi:ribonucleotide monophosphatase NagD (HAD superfamily)
VIARKSDDPVPGRVLAAGDALRTDIAGAAAAGIDSCWILDGIHGNEFERTPAAIDRAASEAGLSPRAVLSSFIW